MIDTLAIIGNAATLGSFGLGRVVAGAALKTGPHAQLAKYADDFFMPVTLTAVGADVAAS